MAVWISERKGGMGVYNLGRIAKVVDIWWSGVEKSVEAREVFMVFNLLLGLGV